MTYHLVCIHPFGNYSKGQIVTDENEVAKLMGDRDHHFNRIAAPVEAEKPAEAEQRVEAFESEEPTSSSLTKFSK